MINLAWDVTRVDGIEYVDGDALVVHLGGRLDPSELIQFLRMLTLDRPWVVLDLARVPELDPSILAILAGAQRRLRPHGYRIALWQLRAQPRQLVNERAFLGTVDVVDGDLRRWLADRRHCTWTLTRAHPGPAPAEPGPPMLSARVVTALGTTTGELDPGRRRAR